MILKFFFNQLSLENKLKYLHKKGVNLGTRSKNGRQIYMYMLNQLFVEVTYQDDRTRLIASEVKVLHGLTNLNQYLETEFRSRF